MFSHVAIRHPEILRTGTDLRPGDLRRLLDANAPKEDVYAAMEAIAKALNEKVDAMFAAARAAGKEIGPDEISNVRELVLEVFFGNQPGLRDAVKAFVGRPDVMADGMHDPGRPAYAAFYFERVARDPDGNDIPSAKEHVLASLGTPHLHPIYAQALVAAARELGRDDPPEAVLALFAAGTPAGDTLRAALGQFDGELDTATLKAFAIGVLQHG